MNLSPADRLTCLNSRLSQLLTQPNPIHPNNHPNHDRRNYLVPERLPLPYGTSIPFQLTYHNRSSIYKHLHTARHAYGVVVRPDPLAIRKLLKPGQCGYTLSGQGDTQVIFQVPFPRMSTADARIAHQYKEDWLSTMLANLNTTNTPNTTHDPQVYPIPQNFMQVLFSTYDNNLRYIRREPVSPEMFHNFNRMFRDSIVPVALLEIDLYPFYHEAGKRVLSNFPSNWPFAKYADNPPDLRKCK